jgi:Ni,Fe-hydrogenase III large subunit
MMMDGWLLTTNVRAEAMTRVPVLDIADFGRQVYEAVSEGCSLSALFALPESASAAGRNARFRMFAVLRDSAVGMLRVSSTLIGTSYPSLTPECPAAHLFEREMAEGHGITPEGHPWLKPVRFPAGSPHECGDASFFRVEGEEVHEVAVGPVHAGVIEPGHFRFQCHGEKIIHLEISLGYQHRGVEHGFLDGPAARRIHFAETLAGDTSIGHATAYCQALEAFSECPVPSRALAIRGMALELERIANHVGDLGALAGDIGFLPTASWCGRIRGDVLNITALLCGSRFGRGLVRPGGTVFDIDADTSKELAGKLAAARRDFQGASGLLWADPSVTARFEGTGVLPLESAVEIGLVGFAARACGIERDIRRDLPSGIYNYAHIPISVWRTGDVFARAYVRWLEAQRSFAFIEEQLDSLPPGETRVAPADCAPEKMVVSLIEGWRGEICHVGITDRQGRIAAYKVVDPSFHNWLGLALAMRGGEISDFPLCNKSFDLSYCGHDL